MITYYLFRHGETDWNAQGRFQGHVDVDLNDRGRAQAQALGEKLKSQNAGIDAILASDLSRSIETAEIVARHLEISGDRIFKHAGIKEAFLGLAQGLTVEEIKAQFGMELLTQWKSNQVSDADIAYPGGESGREVVERTLQTILEFAARHPEFSRIGISTHGGVIRRLMHRILGQSRSLVPPHVPIPNGVVYRIQYDPLLDAWKSLDL